MMHWSGYGWQAVLYALVAGLWGGLMLMAATWIRRRTRKRWWMLTDGLCGIGLVLLLAHSLWQGIEGAIRLFMLLSMGVGMLLFRWGPQAAMQGLLRRIKAVCLRRRG